MAGSHRGVLGGLGLDCAAATAAFRTHIALCARGESADCALILAPHLVGDGPGGDGLAALTVGCVGLAREQLAGLLIALVHWISHWPAAQLLTGHQQPLVVFRR